MSMQGLRRSAITRRLFAAVVVLAVSLKVMVPPGFMLASVDGHARLVMCPAGIHAPGLAHDMRPGMTMAMDDSHAMRTQLAHGAAHALHAAASADQCPFAQAAGGALQPHALQVAAAYFALLRPVTAIETASVPPAPPIRHRAPRGPPSLA